MPVVERRCLISGAEAGRADLVVRTLTERSWSEVRGMFDHGCVEINGTVRLEPGALVAPGDAIKVRFDSHTRYHEKPKPRKDSAFGVIYEDEHLIVVDKAARVLSVPTERSLSKTLVDAVSRHLSHHRRPMRAFVVHRLDRGTSGLLVLAKSSVVAGRLQSELRARKLEREYLAIVSGEIVKKEGTIESVLGTDKSLNRYSRDPDDDDDSDDIEGQHAVTHYRVENVCRGATFVRVQLETGRRHQIRVHFAEAGHPVLGDQRYRNDLSFHPWWAPGRLALHAAVLAFGHPMTGMSMRFESPPPTEFLRFLPGGKGRSEQRRPGTAQQKSPGSEKNL